MDSINLLLFFGASFGLSLGLFFSIILWHRDRQPPFANQFLALLLLFLTLRTGKSVFYNFIELPVAVKNLGLACNLAVGPLLLLYGLSLRNTAFRLRGSDWIHFVPAGIYVMFCAVIPNADNSPAWRLSYSLVILQSLGYALAAFGLWFRGLDHVNIRSRWYLYLTIGLTVMWGVYALIFVGVIPVYLAGAFSFSLLVSILGYLGSRERGLFSFLSLEKYRRSPLNKDRSTRIMSKVRKLLELDQPFLNPKLTLAQLAAAVDTTPKALSQTINEHTGHNFSHFINSYRIEYAKKLFADPQTRQEKIIAIAYRSGFNSLSSFNEVFKRSTTLTPSEFRRQYTKIPVQSFPDS